MAFYAKVVENLATDPGIDPANVLITIVENHDIDWSLKSYKKIHKVNSIEEVVVLMNTLPEKMVKNCMLFFMREDIKPMWEDGKNKDGGSFSYKVSNKNIEKTWAPYCQNME